MASDMETETMRQKLAELLWRREGGHCVSMLVSTLAGGYTGNGSSDMENLCEQAMELAAPLLDHEEAGSWHIDNETDRADLERLAGDYLSDWTGTDDKDLRKQLWEAINDDDAWERFCDAERVEPYEREVFEHWIVSDWLADKLTAVGEKCDKDFAGLTVWARRTTGQAIWLDGVIQGIALAIWPTADDQKRVLAA